MLGKKYIVIIVAFLLTGSSLGLIGSYFFEEAWESVSVIRIGKCNGNPIETEVELETRLRAPATVSAVVIAIYKESNPDITKTVIQNTKVTNLGDAIKLVVTSNELNKALELSKAYLVEVVKQERTALQSSCGSANDNYDHSSKPKNDQSYDTYFSLAPSAYPFSIKPKRAVFGLVGSILGVLLGWVVVSLLKQKRDDE